MDSYRAVAVQGDAESLHCDSRMDIVIAGPIVKEGDKVDNNVFDIGGEEDGEHDCGAVDCSDSLEQSVDMEQREGLVEPRAQHVLHLLRQDTSPLEDECASNAYRP